MRKVIVGAFVSLDGVMQAPGGPDEDKESGFEHGGWVAPFWDEEVDKAMGALMSEPFDLLLGRKTYDVFAAHWPRAEDSPDAETAKLFNSITKYVATSSTAPLTWRNSVAIHDPAVDVARLKNEDGPNLLVQGSTVLIQTLLKHGLVDQFNLLVFPVVLGKGKCLFEPGAPAAALKLVSATTSPSGVTIGSYLPAGPVQTGSFALPDDA
jgi:dihydrofolate reductase